MFQDSRTKKTRANIEDCLIQLLEKYPFRQITVKMITDACQINRSTFYRNYEDKYALLTQIVNRLLKEYQAALRPDFIIQTTPNVTQLRPYFLPLIEFCNKNQKVLVVMWARELPVSLFENMLPLYSEQLLMVLKHHYHLTGPTLNTASYLSKIIASNILITIRWWYEESLTKEEDDLLQLLTATITTNIYQNVEQNFSICYKESI